jgi:stress response protein YsnF
MKETRAMAQRSLTAIYDTRGAAETARDDLIALGIPSHEIIIRGTEEGAASATTAEDRGFWASLSDLFVPDEDRRTYAEGVRRGGWLLNARVPDGLEDQALEALERANPVDLDERAASWRESGWTGYEAGMGAAPAGTPYLAEGGTATREERRSDFAGEGLGAARATTNEAGEQVIPVTEEELRVGKREVGRGSVRVRSYVVERPVEEEVELRQERVTVERRPVNRELQPGDAAFQEQTIEAVERGEEAVVSKTARVVEEVGLRKDVEHEQQILRDKVRRQEVEVEDDRTARGDVGGTQRVETSRSSTDRPID